MSQDPTGVATFDVPDLLGPLYKCLDEMKLAIESDRKNILDQMNRDPVPQFTDEQIDQATGFLGAALGAMQNFVDRLKAPALKTLDMDSLLQLQEKARESARQLVLLFGEAGTAFSGSNLEGALVDLQEGKQSQQVIQRMRSLQAFFCTFARAAWLGDSLTDGEFQTKKELALAILDGLLTPKKLKLPGSESAKPWRCTKCNRRYANICNCNWCLLRVSHDPQVQASAPNPLAAKGKADSAEEASSAASKRLQLNMFSMCLALASTLDDDREKVANMQAKLDAKMVKLRAFAEALNRVPGVLNQYVLVRLCDIGVKESAVLKQWVTHEEATKVHQMLETFRDEAIYERVFRSVESNKRARLA